MVIFRPWQSDKISQIKRNIKHNKKNGNKLNDLMRADVSILEFGRFYSLVLKKKSRGTLGVCWNFGCRDEIRFLILTNSMWFMSMSRNQLKRYIVINQCQNC